jgi:hypothetical protein
MSWGVTDAGSGWRGRFQSYTGTVQTRTFGEIAAALRQHDHASSARLLDAAQHATAPILLERHPLGMLSVRVRTSETTELRLHVWSESTSEFKDALGSIHDHIWTLRSCIVAGFIENLTFEAVADDQGAYSLSHHDYTTEKIHKHPMKYTAVELSRHHVSVGETYDLGAQILHTTIPSSQGTITLVESGYTGATVARILGRSPVGNGTRQKASISEVVAAINQIVPTKTSSPRSDSPWETFHG